jgi:septal ring factor EnvC (AmiA/AmiB activator)
MAKLKKDLQAVSMELKALTRKTERLMRAVDKLEKAQAAAKKPKAKTRAKAKTTRRAPAKKKAAKLTATDQILKIIKRSKKGVDVPTLMKKTGFDDKKVRNIVSKAFSLKKIKRAGRGVYVGA